MSAVAGNGLAHRLVVAIALLCVVVTTTVNLAILRQSHGWDAALYCQAAEVDAAGQDAYTDSHLAGGFSWTYPPLLLNIFRGVCRWSPVFSTSYPAVFVAVLLLCVPLWGIRRRDWPLAICCAYGAFAGATWGLESGNLEILFAIPVSIAFRAVSRGQLGRAAVCLGVLASVKLLPLAYCLCFAFLPLPWRDRLRAMAMGGVSAVVFWTALTFSRPDRALSYLRQLAGMLPAQYSAAAEVGHITQPAFPYFIGQLLHWPNQVASLARTEPLAVAIALALVIVMAVLASPKDTESDRISMVFAFSFLAVHLMLPRLKPYTFALMAPALFALLRRLPPLGQGLLLLGAVLWPAVALLHLITPWAFIPALLLNYNQTLAVLGTLLLVMAVELHAKYVALPYR